MDPQPAAIKSRLLVIGADSVIGAGLLARLDGPCWNAVGTTRRPETVAANRILLDLATVPEEWDWPRPVAAAVICAGVTRVEVIARDPGQSNRVNVEGISALVERLAAEDTFVVFLSSSAVLDGSRPFSAPEDRSPPPTVYGQQKRLVEESVLRQGTRGSVVRLGKVLEPGFPLFRDWAAALARGETIAPFADMPFAPVPLAFVVEVLTRVLANRVAGILQVSGDRDITYAEAAHHVARRVGASAELVRPVLFRDRRPELTVPRFATMDTSRLIREMGLVPPDVWSAIDWSLGFGNALATLRAGAA